MGVSAISRHITARPRTSSRNSNVACAVKSRAPKNRMKANKRVAKQHDRVTNLRQNMLHEFTTQVVEGHGIICIEDLNLKGLVQTRLAKSFSDAAIGETIVCVRASPFFRCRVDCVELNSGLI